MAKRKESDQYADIDISPSKRSRKDLSTQAREKRPTTSSPRKSKTSIQVNGSSTPTKAARSESNQDDLGDSDEETTSTPKVNGKTLFATPTKTRQPSKSTPSKSAKADRSAKRKSAQHLVSAQGQEDDWDNSAALARAILAETENIIQSTEPNGTRTIEVDATTEPVTPSKRSRGRPKGAKNKRSPTPEGDLPPEERYFFQNRTGPQQISANSFARLGLLSHDEFFTLRRGRRPDHEFERDRLSRLHARAFPQWRFELEEGFSICMYGYGSKRKLMNDFAQWIYSHSEKDKRIVVLNGYVMRINLRNVLHTIGNALVGKEETLKLMGQPHEMVDTILAHLAENLSGQLILFVNSIDSSALRRASIQSVLARLAAHPKVYVVASADTPTFPVLWSSGLKDQFQFAFHDCTTFAPYDAEINVVDDVNELLGRKNRRVGGKEGIGFVLKSLPENARSLYRILLTEVLTVLNDGQEDLGGEDEEIDYEKKRQSGTNAEDVGIEYKALYQKASEEFICSSDMNFRFLLKEFHDHQMLTSRRDPSGTEVLGVPLQRDEMEVVLEDLVIG